MFNQFMQHAPNPFSFNQFGFPQAGFGQNGFGQNGFTPFATPWGLSGNWQQQPWQTQNWNGQNWFGATTGFGMPTQGLPIFNNTTPNITAQSLTQMLINLSTQTQMQLQLQQFALQQALTLVQQIAAQNQNTTLTNTGTQSGTAQGNYNQFVQGQLQQNPSQFTTNSNAGYGLGWGMFPGYNQQQPGQFSAAGMPNNLGTGAGQFNPQWIDSQAGQQFGQQGNTFASQGIGQGFAQGTQQGTQGFGRGNINQGVNGINQAYGPAVFGQGTVPWQQQPSGFQNQPFPTQNVTPLPSQQQNQQQGIVQNQTQNLTQTSGQTQSEFVEPVSHKRLSRQSVNAG